jgi:polyferredoxin
VLVYGAVLAAIGVAFVVSLALRESLRVDVVRDRASLARIVEEGRIENVYRLQLMNASEAVRDLSIAVEGMPGIALSTTPRITLQPAEARWLTVGVRVPPEAGAAAGAGAHSIRFRVTSGADGAKPIVERSTFVVPR